MCLITSVSISGLCPQPAVNLNSKVKLSTDGLAENTVATYSCDNGFLRLG